MSETSNPHSILTQISYLRDCCLDQKQVEIVRLEAEGLLEQLEATQKALADAVDVAIWLTGLPCLNPESEAWSYWESGARPKLYKAMELLDSNPAKSPES